MESPIQLINMPEDSMRHILERCDFVSIQCLRKTCHTFRNFIDKTKPKQSMKVLKVVSFLNCVCLIACKNDDDEHYPNGQKIELYYERLSSKHTTITWKRSDEERTKTINKGDNLDVFSDDLLTVLECNQSKWDEIYLKCEEEVLNEVQNIFLSRKSPFKVHSLIIDNDQCKKPIMAILSSVCSDTLTCLGLDSQQKWNMSKMKKLEQWKKVKELYMAGTEVRADIDSYSHFEFAKVCFTKIKMKDLFKVKEIFLNTRSTTKYLEIHVNFFPNPDYLTRIFGECFVLDDGMDAYKHWFFKRSDNYVVKMQFAKYFRFFIFNIIAMEDVPDGAFISSS
ncbi:unnamed protein product [Caenorhabditis brenneri]